MAWPYGTHVRHEGVEGQSGAREIQGRVKDVGEAVPQGVVRHGPVRQDSRRVIVHVTLLLGRAFDAPPSAFGLLVISVNIGKTRQAIQMGWSGIGWDGVGWDGVG